MTNLVLFIILGIFLGVGGWQLTVWLGETRDKNRKYRAASTRALKRNKPLLVVGGPWGNKRVRHWFNKPAHGSGDVCVDIDHRAIADHPHGIVANVTHLPFPDKIFGAAFASHLLEHLPTTGDAMKALEELNRVAEAVFVVSPSRQSVAGWVIADHHLWVWQKGDKTYLKQRGGAGIEEEYLKPAGTDTSSGLALKEEADRLARQLFGNDAEKCADFTSRLLDICARARGKDFLLIHNPGGWGSTPLEHLLKWERSSVEGVIATLEEMGYSWLLTQYFRSGSSRWAHLREIKKESGFFFKGTSFKAEVMAAELKFIVQHLGNLKVILLGASQGAAFSNAVMRQLGGGLRQVYSIELGIFFPHLKRRIVTERTLAIDSNGLLPDPMVHRNLLLGFKIYITAPFRWIKYRMQGKPKKFTHCISAPGHDYSWEYPKVRQQIVDFLKLNFGSRKSRT